MDALGNALGPLGEMARSMSPGTRRMAVLSLLAVVAGAAWLWNERADAPDTYLLGGQSLSPTQLRDMESAFGKAGLDDYQIEGGRVRVPLGRQSKYMAALGDGGALPVDFGEHLKKAANATGFMLFGPRQEAQAKVALQSELQLVISRMKGIEKAFVHIAEETSRSFPQTKTVTASVGVQPRDNQGIDESTVAAIRSFVASAWGGLKPEGVTVVDLSGNRLYAGDAGGEAKPRSVGGDDAKHKRQLERDWQDKIAHVLAIPGARVTADVDLDPAGRRPPRVWVCVAVPQGYYDEVWRKRHASTPRSTFEQPDPAALGAIQLSEANRIRAAILPLLGPSDPRVDRSAQIAVSTILDPAVLPVVEPDAREKLLSWLLQSRRTLGMGGLILSGLLMLRSTIKSLPLGPAADLAVVKGDGLLLAADAPSDLAMETAGPAPKPLPAPSESLRRELLITVREHPQAAAGVLRTWIGNAN